MNEKAFHNSLKSLPLGQLRFYQQTGSTNDIALAWATEGAPDLSLVFADEQTTGRGRMNRKWITPPGSALAFSLLIRPTEGEAQHISLFSGLGALALVNVLKRAGMTAQVKWPNDVLVRGKKLAGILVESVWLGEQVDCVVIGMGVNVLAGAVPPAEQVLFPATSIESEGLTLAREILLHDLLTELLSLRPSLGTEGFLRAWEDALAFNGGQVQVWGENQGHLSGVVRGLGADGSLRLETSGGIQSIQFGEIHLRPL